jgi:2OG-Fe(II) oxygenase superfamily
MCRRRSRNAAPLRLIPYVLVPLRRPVDHVTAEPRTEGVAAVDMARLESQVEVLRARYQSASPFPHIVLDNFLDPEVAALAMDEFPPLDGATWTNYVHANERKFSHTDPSEWGPTLRSILADLNSQRFVDFMGQLAGFDCLIADQSLEGGGLHQSAAGGFLNIHADFTVHPHHPKWQRRTNLLLYLNEDWKPEYGGDLELWSTDMKSCDSRIAPVANRVVIFTTDVDSYHGHPEPMTCPPDVRRRSLALYYFSIEDDPIVRSTDYRARPGDGARSVLIYADKQALRTYDWLKRRVGLSDQTASRLLGFMERLRRNKPQDSR